MVIAKKRTKNNILPGQLCFPGFEAPATKKQKPEAPRGMSKQDRILEFIRSCPEGVTCEEAEKALHFQHQSVSARFGDLYNLNRIRHLKVDGIAVTRKTRSGKSAHVWIARETEP